MREFALDGRALARQALFEHELLERLKEALRLAKSWRVDSVGFERKRSSVCFTAQSLCRHLERLMELEEEGGYMGDVLEAKPQLADDVAALRDDHDEFRRMLADLMPRTADCSLLGESELEELCDELESLLVRIDEHDKREIDLYQEGLLSEEGGEGG